MPSGSANRTCDSPPDGPADCGIIRVRDDFTILAGTGRRRLMGRIGGVWGCRGLDGVAAVARLRAALGPEAQLMEAQVLEPDDGPRVRPSTPATGTAGGPGFSVGLPGAAAASTPLMPPP